MRIAGFVKQSFIDYPGEIASVVFFAGCNLRCPFCHNPHLVLPDRYPENLPEDTVLHYLEKNASLLDAVVITGGEPLMNSDLPGFLSTIRKLNLKIKIDTNGSFPELLQIIIEKKLADYIAMDIKQALVPEKYNDAAGNLPEPVFKKIQRSVSLINNSGIDHEFRTTIVKGIHTANDLVGIGKMLGGQKWVIQEFRKSDVLDPEKAMSPFSEEEINAIFDMLKSNNINASRSLSQ